MRRAIALAAAVAVTLAAPHAQAGPLRPPAIAFASFRTGNYDIWVVRPDGSGQTQLTTDPEQDEQPAWGPKGRRILFRSFRAGSYDVWTMRADGTDQRALTTHPDQDEEPAQRARGPTRPPRR